MQRRDMETPWLSRQGPPSLLLLLSITRMEGWSYRTNFLNYIKLPKLQPPPPVLHLSLSLPVFLY